MGFAQITIAGNLGTNPEMKYSPEGKARTQFSVAVSNSRPDGQGGWTDDTDWFRCTVFGARAEGAAEKLRKGNKIVVTGRFKSREWSSQNTGKSGTALEIVVDNYQLMERRDRTGEEPSFGQAGPQEATPVASGNADIDDLPF